MRGAAIETDPRRERNRIAERVTDGGMERRGQGERNSRALMAPG